MRKIVLTLSAVLVLVAFTFAGCSSSDKKTTGTKTTTKKTTEAKTTTKKATTAPATK
jgi:type IV pilus biogenesis protein CpaD/CtpE